MNNDELMPFEISDRFQNLKKESNEVLDCLISQAKNEIAHFESLRYMFVTVERDEVTRQVRLIFDVPGSKDMANEVR